MSGVSHRPGGSDVATELQSGDDGGVPHEAVCNDDSEAMGLRDAEAMGLQEAPVLADEFPGRAVNRPLDRRLARAVTVVGTSWAVS